MSLFTRARDLRLFNQISKELVEKIVDTIVILYKLKHDVMETNIYGESDNKQFENGVCIAALINHEDQTGEYSDVGHDLYQNVTIAMHRPTLELLDIYPQVGDYLEYNNSYYEIDEIVENQLIGGNVAPDWNFSFRCRSHMVSRDSINVEDVRPGIDRNSHQI